MLSKIKFKLRKLIDRFSDITSIEDELFWPLQDLPIPDRKWNKFPRREPKPGTRVSVYTCGQGPLYIKSFTTKAVYHGDGKWEMPRYLDGARVMYWSEELHELKT